MLKDAGAEVVTANDGKAAVDAFAASAPETFDCVLMDLMMPVMSGYEATRVIRAMDRADAKTVPIIALSANAFDEDVAMAKDAGMDEHLAKPVDMGENVPGDEPAQMRETEIFVKPNHGAAMPAQEIKEEM